MEELLRLESTRFYGSNNSGCIWGLFHIFDSYQRREKKRMLSYRRMGGYHYGAGVNTLMENETGGEDTVTNNEANSMVDNKACNIKKSSGKTRIMNFISKKLLKKQKHKGKISHSSSHLMRTISVHQSESKVYETSGELSQMASDSETSTTALNLDEADSWAVRELESLVINGHHIDCTSHKVDELGNHLLDEHIILKEKLFVARDALLKQKDSDPKGITVEFSLLSNIFLETLHLFNTNREALYNVCKGRDSFAANKMQALGCSARARPLNRSVSLKVGSESESMYSPAKIFGIVPDIEVVPGSYELRNQGETKEGRRISMDGILDKVPSGQKLQEDEEDDKLHPRVGPVSRDGLGFKINGAAPGSSNGKFEYNRVRRSRSLTESLDRYSQLMDSISANEVRRVPERSNSIREGRGLLHGKLPKTHRRLPSNPEFLSSYSFIKDLQSEVSIAFQSPKKPKLAAAGSDKLNKDLFMQPVAEEIAYEPDKFINPAECPQIVPFQFSKALGEINNFLNEQESQIEDEPDVKPEKTSPISVLDHDIEEPISPLKFTVMTASDPQQLQENLKEQLPCPRALNTVDFNELNIAELSDLNFNEESSTVTVDVDEKDAARFNYVKHILSKTGYEALLCDSDDSSIEAEPTEMLCGLPFEEQLIYDLINEVLFEIYEYSTVPSSWISRFHPKIRSTPTGSYLLGEVWAEIRWHLSSPQELDAMIDKILARNFSKTEDWMNLYRDAECFGLLLEQLILDDLVGEVFVEIDEL